MRIEARRAGPDDVPAIARLYADLEREQAELKSMWPVLDGLELPVEGAIHEILEDDRSLLVLGTIDEVPFGFGWARSEAMLHRAEGERVGVVRLIYVDPEARGVAVGEAMIEWLLARLRESGHRRFDARVSPGHRLAKNFFEQNGFAARLIIMHHEDEPAEGA